MIIDLSFSRLDLFFAILGIRVLKKPPASANNGTEYYLYSGTNTLKDFEWNWKWFGSTKEYLENNGGTLIPFREWLVAKYLLYDVNHTSPFTALPGSFGAWFDLLNDNIESGMQGQTENDALSELTKDGNFRRKIDTAISLAFTFLSDNSTLCLGTALRRTIQIYDKNVSNDILQADIDLYIPISAFNVGSFSLSDFTDQTPSIQLGLSITGTSTGDTDQSLNCPFTIGGKSTDITGFRVFSEIPYTSAGDYGSPSITLQIRKENTTGTPGEGAKDWTSIDMSIPTGSTKPKNWTNLTSWITAFLKKKSARPCVPTLLTSPIGPFDVQMLRAFKTYIIEKWKSLPSDPQLMKAQGTNIYNTITYLKQLKVKGWNPKDIHQPDEEKLKPSQKSNTLNVFTFENFLTTLGLISKPKKEHGQADPPYTYTQWSKMKEISIWNVLKNIIDGFDGFPLYSSKLSPKKGTTGELGTTNTQVTLAATKNCFLTTEEENYFGIRAALSDYLLIDQSQKSESTLKDERTNIDVSTAKTNRKKLDYFLQFGKWFTGESQDNNWLGRLLPTISPGSGVSVQPPCTYPGAGIFPISYNVEDNKISLNKSGFLELVSMGLDIDLAEGATMADALICTPRFGIGGAETRFVAITDFKFKKLIALGPALKLNNIWLNLVPMPGGKDPATSSDPEDEILGSLSSLFAEDDGEQTEKKEETSIPIQTFSLLVSYLRAEGRNSYDIELYDSKGVAGSVVWIPFERKAGPLFFDSIGIGASKVDKDNPEVTILAKGSLDFSRIKFELLGAGVSFYLKNPKKMIPILDGLGFSFQISSLYMDGEFLKTISPYYNEAGKKVGTTNQYEGTVSIRVFNKFTITGMGAYGKLPDGKTSLFIYGFINLAQGIGSATVRVTGLALGFGINRKVIAPPMSQIANFPLVKAVMGSGGLDPLGKGLNSHNDTAPSDILTSLSSSLQMQEGEYFGCFGLRFKLVEIIDCFGLGIFQFGDEFEIILLGLSRMKEPSNDFAICYLELGLEVIIKPEVGTFIIEGQLTNSSWLFEPDCVLTGGFALAFWFGGEHKGNFVATVGGYNPHFSRPSFYPLVPRLGFNWQITSDLFFKGGLYYALTTSQYMEGGSLEAVFNTSVIKATFTAYADLLLQWHPFYYEIDAGVSLHIHVDLWLISFGITIGASFSITGPPFYGWAKIHLSVISFEIEFGDKPDNNPQFIQNWANFGKAFVEKTENLIWSLDKTETISANGPKIAQAFCIGGGNNQSTSNSKNTAKTLKATSKTSSSNSSTAQDDTTWCVRADEAVFSVESVVPISTICLFTPKVGTQVNNVQSRDNCGKFLILSAPISITDEKNKNHTIASDAQTGIRPMGISSFSSTLNVTVVTEEDFGALDLSDWTCKPDQSAIPGALWDSEFSVEVPKTPEAKVIKNCIMGIKELKPPAATLSTALGPLTLQSDAMDPQYTVPSANTQPELATATEKDANSTLTEDLVKTNDIRKNILTALGDAGFYLPSAEQKMKMRCFNAVPLVPETA